VILAGPDRRASFGWFNKPRVIGSRGFDVNPAPRQLKNLKDENG
jgi:hypothetical protein